MPSSPRPARLPLNFKAFLFTGLAAILPTLLIVLIVVKGFDIVHGLGGAQIASALHDGPGDAPFGLRLLGDFLVLGLLVALALGAGFLLRSVFGRYILSLVEQGLLRIPLVRGIYPALRQLTDFLVSGKRPSEFQRVVAVPYPHPGIWSIGFVTGEGIAEVSAAAGKPLLTVFVPSSPAPFTGWICLVPRDQAVQLKMSVEEAVRFCVSVGVSRPAGTPVPAPQSP